MDAQAPISSPDAAPLEIGMLLYPGVTLLDLAGPQAALGVWPGRERVVADRDRFTGGGVTAGIDFGLALLAELRGEQVAKVTQLLMEYDPAAPFDTGHPGIAGPELIATALKIMGEDTLAEGIEIARARREREPA